MIRRIRQWLHAKDGPFGLSWAELLTPLPYSEPDEYEKLRHFTPIATVEFSGRESNTKAFVCLRESGCIFRCYGNNRYALSHSKQLEALQHAHIPYVLVRGKAA